jgi:hypothetical protein
MTDIRVLRGLRNTESEDRFVDGDLSTADNIDLDNTGKPHAVGPGRHVPRHQ